MFTHQGNIMETVTLIDNRDKLTICPNYVIPLIVYSFHYACITETLNTQGRSPIIIQFRLSPLHVHSCASWT